MPQRKLHQPTNTTLKKSQRSFTTLKVRRIKCEKLIQGLMSVTICQSMEKMLSSNPKSNNEKINAAQTALEKFSQRNKNTFNVATVLNYQCTQNQYYFYHLFSFPYILSPTMRGF